MQKKNAHGQFLWLIPPPLDFQIAGIILVAVADT
jgi:hypothetical protein